MGIVQDLIAKYKSKKEHEKEVMSEIKLQHKITERAKDANERELERYHEEARKASVEAELKNWRQAKSNQIWRHNMFTNNGFLFKGSCNLGRVYY